MGGVEADGEAWRAGEALPVEGLEGIWRGLAVGIVVELGEDADARQKACELVAVGGWRWVGWGGRLGLIEDDAGDAEAAAGGDLDGAEGVVEGSEGAAGDDKQGVIEIDGESDEGGILGDRAMQAADTFEQDEFAAGFPPGDGVEGACVEFGVVEAAAFEARGDGRGQRSGEEQRYDAGSGRVEAGSGECRREAAAVVAQAVVGAGGSGGDGLEGTNAATLGGEEMDERGGEAGFANPGIGGDDE